jgi:hypothetical protein
MEMKIQISDTFRNLPLGSNEIPPQSPIGKSSYGSRSYNFSQTITDLAVNKFRKTGKGITYRDLMNNGIVIHKNQA